MTFNSLLTISLSIFFTVILLFVCRLWWILPTFRTQSRPLRRSTAKLVIVLGSGGHTAEMLRLIEPLDFKKYKHRLYVVSSGDTLSEGKARAFELRKQSAGNGSVFSFMHVPRARRVGQSWLTSPFTSLQSLFGSLRAVLVKPLPDAILCNGPGTCVLLCIAALIPRFWGFKYIPIIYIETFARVTSLSLSGKILLYLADRFFVQWPDLAKRYQRAEYIGILM